MNILNSSSIILGELMSTGRRVILALLHKSSQTIFRETSPRNQNAYLRHSAEN